MANGSSQSTNTCPPHSPTRTTNNSILNPAGAFHLPNTSSIRFWAFSYSAGEPCGRSNQLIMYFTAILLIVLVLGTTAVWTGTAAAQPQRAPPRVTSTPPRTPASGCTGLFGSLLVSSTLTGACARCPCRT